MDEQELQEQEAQEQEVQEEFNLEDIIREFHQEPIEPEQQEEPAQKEDLEEPEELEETEEAEEDIKPYVKGAAKPQETPASVTGDTIRLEKIPQTQGTVRNAQPITKDETQEQEEKTEPYSEKWEPEYEQPIAEYIPPQPIAFRPRSRLRELKRQLVAGPEKQYYALSEIGLGKLQLAIFLSLLVVLLSVAASALYAVGAIPQTRLRLMVFGQFWVMLVSALLGSFQLIQGAADLVHKKFSMNTLLLFTFLLCCADGIVCLGQLRVPCCAAFSLQVTMSLWCTYQKRNTMLGQLDTMRKAVRLDSVSAKQDYYEGAKGFIRSEGKVEQFMDSYSSEPKLQKTVSVYTLIALCLSVAVGVLAGVLHGVSTGIQVASVTALAAMPASMFVTMSRPMSVLEKRLHGLGALLCGWKGAEGLTGKAVFPLEHEDLFPAGTVQLNGVKFFGSRLPDTIIAYASAIMEAGESSLEPIFTQLLESRNGRHYPVENFRIYDGGLGGEVCGEPVLVGGLSFLKDMGVDLPEGIRVQQAVCLAVDGELCGLFVLTFEKDRDSAAGISTLTAYRRLRPILTAGDFMLTPEFVREMFGKSTKRVLYPEKAQRDALRKITAEPDDQALAMTTAEGLASIAYAVTGARSVTRAATAGVVVHMAGGILGILMMLVLAILGATHLLTPINLFLYELVWLIPGFLITEWPHSI